MIEERAARLRLLELFAGMGGWRMAFGEGATLAAAYDISPLAVATYARIHGERPLAKELAHVPGGDLLAHGADTWAMSPPCQPFCRMGKGLGLEDPRSRAFLHLLEILRVHPPRHLVLESVAGFLGSQAHELLLQAFRETGMHALDYRLCPTAFGIPNQRPRAFVVASREPLEPLHLPHCTPQPLAPYLDAQEDPSLYLPPEIRARHGQGLDLVTAASTRSACFIGGYGQKYVGSGSFLETPRGIRRFSVGEVARLLGWPGVPAFPEDVGLEGRYRLLGNGLSLPVARWVAAHLAPGLQIPASVPGNQPGPSAINI